MADLWACFEGEDYGEFRDIDKLTMFADYRVPQILNSLGCIYYSPPLGTAIRAKNDIPQGGSWEMQLRGKHVGFLNGDRILTPSSLQHLVRGAAPQGDRQTTPRDTHQRRPARLLPVRHNKGDGSRREGDCPAPPDKEYLVLSQAC